MLLASLSMGACATHRGPVPSEIFDERTALTVLVAAKPLVFARERSDVAAHARDYATAVPIEIDASGEYRQYLLVYRWSTVDRRLVPKPDPLAGELRIVADGRVVELTPLDALPLRIDRNRELLVPKHGDVVAHAYAVSVGLLRYLATSHDLVVSLPREPLATPFHLWEDGRGAWLAFLSRTDTP